MDNAENIARIRIRTDEEGIPKTLSLVRSTFLDRLTAPRETWDTPIVIFGPDREAEISATAQTRFNDKPPIYVSDLREFSHRISKRFPHRAATDVIDFAYRPSGHLQSKFDDRAATSPISMNEILSLAEKGSFSQHDLYIIEDTVSELRDDIERLCLSSAVRIKWGSNRTILPAFLASIWLEKPRQYPLIVESNKELLSRAERWENYESAKIVFSDLCDQLNFSFNTSLESVVEAYKVWQLSRGNEEEKTFATVPNFISFSNAQRFLTVFASAQIRPAGTISKLAIQVPAPIIFDRTEDTITVSTKLTSSEKSEITRQVSTKLLYNVDRIIDGQSLLNICPASKDILSDIRRDLILIQDNKYDDGTIVGIGIQFNALQWNIDSVKDQISDSSIGELVGLFATADIFLRRFPVWCDYVGLAAPITTTPDGLAQYRLARSLLRNATSTPHLLKDVAQDRISTVLQGISTESSSPAVLDGIVRSGDNLAAIALNSVSEVVVSEAKSFGSSVKKEVYSQGSKAAIKFVAENAEEITKLSGARQWPWAKWALQLIKQVSDISSLI